jgi:hypothetical protein
MGVMTKSPSRHQLKEHSQAARLDFPEPPPRALACPAAELRRPKAERAGIGRSGFLGYYITDAGGGTIFSTTIFETKANAEESNRIAAEWVGKNPSVLPPATRVTTGEVIGHKVK